MRGLTPRVRRDVSDRLLLLNQKHGARAAVTGPGKEDAGNGRKNCQGIEVNSKSDHTLRSEEAIASTPLVAHPGICLAIIEVAHAIERMRYRP